MNLRKRFPLALVACLALSLFATTALAQTDVTRPRQVAKAINPDGLNRLENDIEIISVAADESEPEESLPLTPPLASRASLSRARFDQLLAGAIDTRLGARYVWGAAGPTVFDCSGFVWSAFQAAGIHFDRSSARTLWSRFAPARPEEESKFGTLVFFNNLTHIGIVADANGFYHASRHHGVTYSPFNDYWMSRIDGFRRVPVPAALVAE